MMTVMATATKDDVLRRHVEFEKIFDEMINQSIKCSIYISEYVSGNYARAYATYDAESDSC
jgi:hypothetical protein